MKILERLYYKLIKKNPANMEMVKYWKTKDSVQAKVTRGKDGSLMMWMEGEKYPFPGFPRGHLLFGSLSPLKHQIKNQIFNESWAKLEAGEPREEIINDIKSKLHGPIAEISENSKYDMLKMSSMCPAVREICRAWTKVSPDTADLRDYLCFILQEDDGYRFRVQWLVTWFGWTMKLNPVKHFDKALAMLEHGEVIGDMKERQRLLRRILMLYLEDPQARENFIKLFKEIKWSKVKLTKADKYYFRAKYFKCDLDVLEY